MRRLNKLHHHLMNTNLPYAQWHHNPRYTFYHWAIFLSFTLLLGLMVVNFVATQTVPTYENTSSFAQTVAPTPSATVNLSFRSTQNPAAPGEVVIVEAMVESSVDSLSALDATILYPTALFDLVSFSIPTTGYLPTVLGPIQNSDGTRLADTKTPGKINVVLGSGTQGKSGSGVFAILKLRAKNVSQQGAIEYDPQTQAAVIGRNTDAIKSLTPLLFTIASLTPTPTRIPTLIPSNTPTPTTGISIPGQGLLGRYYNSLNLTGVPIERVDSTINFNWSGNAPMSGINNDQFSVRWEGQIQPQTSNWYTFYTKSDDGVRLWVNNQLLINDWTNHSAKSFKAGQIYLESGKKYSIKLEYYEAGGYAFIQLLWSTPQLARQIIPSAFLYPSVVTQPTTSASNLNISITNPPNGVVLPSSGTILFSATATSTSNIVSIQLFIDGKRVKTCTSTTSCTYSIGAKNMPAGQHIFRADAKDSTNATATSSVTVTK